MSIKDDVCVKVWMRRRLTGYNAFKYFAEFLCDGLKDDAILSAMTPSELVKFQLEHTVDPNERFRILNALQTWVNSLDLRLNSKKTVYGHVRSFFLHNRVELPSDPSFSFREGQPPVRGDLTVDNFKRVILGCNPMYRAVFLMMFQGFMDEKRFCYVNTHYASEILEHVTKNDGEFTLYLPGRKRSAPFCTVLSTHGDWCKAFKEYLRTSDKSFDKALFWNSQGKSLIPKNLQYYFNAMAVRCGVIKRANPECGKCGFDTVRAKKLHPLLKVRKVCYVCKRCQNIVWALELEANRCSVRYGVNPHEMRDLARSRWQSSGADPVVAEFLMGHTNKVDSNKYLDWMKYEQKYPLKEYRTALPFLNILSEDPEKIDRSQVEMRFEGQKAQIELLQNQLGMVNRKLELFERPEVKKWLRDKMREDGIKE